MGDDGASDGLNKEGGEEHEEHAPNRQAHRRGPRDPAGHSPALGVGRGGRRDGRELAFIEHVDHVQQRWQHE